MVRVVRWREPVLRLSPGRRPAGTGPRHRGADLAGEPVDGPAHGGDDAVVAGDRGPLLADQAAAGPERPSALGLADPPARVEHDLAALARVEPVDLDLHRAGRLRLAARRQEDDLAAPGLAPQPLGQEAQEHRLQRLGPLVELAQAHAVVAGAGHDLGPVEVVGQAHRPEAQDRPGARLLRPCVGRRRQGVEPVRQRGRAGREQQRRERGAGEAGGEAAVSAFPGHSYPPLLPRTSASG
jgi:hypothetical protein